MTEIGNKTLIIGFSGKIGSGKDFISKHIFLPFLEKKIKNINYLFLSFADPVKQECAMKYECSYEKLYQNKDSLTRKRLQEVGSDFREKVGAKVYVNAMKMNIKLHSERSNINVFIIPDVRYPGEMKFIQDNGGVVYRVTAIQRSLDKLTKECKGDEKEMEIRSNHLSETALDNALFNGHICNDYGECPIGTCELFVDHIISIF
jgi:phosphopentomutase